MTRGLPQHLWDTLRHALSELGPAREDIERAARWLAAGGWGFCATITPTHLAQRPGLHDLLTQAAAWKGGPVDGARKPRKEGTRNQPSWEGDAGDTAEIVRRIEERSK